MSNEMGLAESIRANTAAVQALTAILASNISKPLTVTVEQIDLNPVSEASASEAAAVGSERLNFEADVKPLAMALAKKDREVLLAVLKKFDAAKASDVPVEKLFDFRGALHGAIAGLAGK